VESIYTKPWNYTISALITYEDKTTSEADVTLVVK
jgi:hypothetical protein